MSHLANTAQGDGQLGRGKILLQKQRARENLRFAARSSGALLLIGLFRTWHRSGCRHSSTFRAQGCGTCDPVV